MMLRACAGKLGGVEKEWIVGEGRCVLDGRELSVVSSGACLGEV